MGGVGPDSDQARLRSAAPVARQAAAGTSASQRSLRDHVEHELVPRLLVAHRVGPVPPSLAMAAARELDAFDIQRFTELVLRGDEEHVARFVSELTLRGVPVETVYLDLLAPTARALGDLWADDACDFMDVTLALGRMQRALRELGSMTGGAVGDAAHERRVLLACVPGEQHTLGMFMVAELFLRDAWNVSAGPPLSEPELLQSVRDGWFDVIGFSIACGDRVSTLKHQLAKVRRASRNPDVVLMVGGRVFTDDPTLVARVGADGYAPDAREATGVADSLLAARRGVRQAPAARDGSGER